MSVLQTGERSRLQADATNLPLPRAKALRSPARTLSRVSGTMQFHRFNGRTFVQQPLSLDCIPLELQCIHEAEAGVVAWLRHPGKMRLVQLPVPHSHRRRSPSASRCPHDGNNKNDDNGNTGHNKMIEIIGRIITITAITMMMIVIVGMIQTQV